MEQNALYQLGADGDPGTESATQKDGAKTRAETPIQLFNCPSRRSCKTYPSGISVTNSGLANPAGKTDYACSSGNSYASVDPGSYSASKSYSWPTPTSTGVIFGRSEITIGEIRDGTSNTFLIGEKYQNPTNYETGSSGSDNEPIYTAADWDAYRLSTTSYPPLQDRAGYMDASSNFGSVHAGGFGVVMCDGSVQNVSYSIDTTTYQYLGSRNDGKVAAID